MSEKLNGIKLLIKKILPNNSKVGMKSSVISFLFSLICSIICFALFRGGSQQYHDIVAGNITLPGVYKSVDFYTYYTFIVVYLVMFLVFNYVFNNRIVLVKENAAQLQTKHFLIGLLPAFIILLLKMKTVPIFDLSFCLFFIAIIVVLNKAKMKSENIIKLATSCFFLYLSSSGFLALTSYYFPKFADRGTKYFIPAFWILLCIAGYIIYLFTRERFKTFEDVLVDIISSITQFIIPLNLYSLINTRYYYQGIQYIPEYHSRLKTITITVIALFSMVNLITIIKVFVKKNRINCVSMSTLISFITVCFWDTGYNLLINTDQFHTGETAVVYQQIIEKGQKWGTEFVSVLQGLGFSLSWINEIIFGGKYSTYVQAQNILLVIMAVLTTVLLYIIVEHKYLTLLIAPIMPLFYMNRIFLIAPVFLFLLIPRIIRKPIVWTYCYIFTCIVHVWYQPTYGGAVAASLIPVLIFIWYNAFRNNILDLRNKKNLFSMILFILSVGAIGICCIPLLLNAIHFLKTNGYETMIGNGVSVIQTLTYEPSYLTGINFLDMIIQFIFKFGSGLAALIIMVYFFLRYVVNQKDEIKQVQGVILTVSTTLAYLLMLPSILTRIDPGISRIGGTSFTFFGFLIIVLIYLYRDEIEIKKIAILICGISLCAGFYITFPTYLQIHQKANSIVTIPDDAIYVKPDETGLYNLGYAFILDKQYLHEAMVINEMCEYLLLENQTYYDFTDKSVYYLLTDKKVPGLYVSSMVAANELLQNESIDILKENDVPLIFINNPLRYMGISESLRSYRIYRYFMEQNYRFVRYKGCNFLVRNDIDLSPIQSNIEPFYQNNKIGIYDSQIKEESYNSSMLDELSRENITDTNSIKLTDEKMYITDTDPFLVFDTNNRIEFNNIQLVEINFENYPIADMTGQLFVETENINYNETNTIHFDIKSNRVLIPLYNYEQFNLDSKLVNLRLDFDNVSAGIDVTVESVKLFSLNNEQKLSLDEKFIKLSGGATDNRLDEIFHQPNLMNLPLEWGNSFEFMKNRFTASQIATCGQEETQVIDSPVSIHFSTKQAVSGSEGEFLRIKLAYMDNIKRKAVIKVKGVDKNGNKLSEDFEFEVSNGNILIPIASSPNCLQAKKLTGFDVIFLPYEQPYKVKINEAQMYQLNK